MRVVHIQRESSVDHQMLTMDISVLLLLLEEETYTSSLFHLPFSLKRKKIMHL